MLGFLREKTLGLLSDSLRGFEFLHKTPLIKTLAFLHNTHLITYFVVLSFLTTIVEVLDLLDSNG